MTSEEQRIAIAEACGLIATDAGWCRHDAKSGITQDFIVYSDDSELPDYLNDLNACHDMEKVLNAPDWIRYHGRLRGIVMNAGSSQAQEICATAAQRCEAFLRCLNLWKP